MSTVMYNSSNVNLLQDVSFLDEVKNLLHHISTKKVIRKNTSNQAKELIDNLDGKTIISNSEYDNMKRKISQLVKENADLTIALNNCDNNDLSKEYSLLKDEYEESRATIMDLSVQLATETQQNTNRKFKINALKTENDFLKTQLDNLTRHLNKVTEENNILTDKMIDRHNSRARLAGIPLESQEFDKYDTIDFHYCAEYLNQYISSNTCLHTSHDLNDIIKYIIDIIQTSENPEHIYITSMIQEHVISRYDVSDKIIEMGQDPFYKDFTLAEETIVSIIYKEIDSINHTIYTNLCKKL